MAQRVITSFIDDLDGSEAEGTVRFALDGADYEIDLNRQNAETLRAALDPYTLHARRTSNGTRARQAGAARIANGRRPASVDGQREYLRLLGHDVNERGRIPALLAAIPVPPRNQWPAARTAAEPAPADDILADEMAQMAAQTADEPPGSIEADEPPPVAEVAFKAAADIVPEPAPAKPTRTASGYDPEFRAKAVAQAKNTTIAGTAKALGVSEGSLRNWINAARK